MSIIQASKGFLLRSSLWSCTYVPPSMEILNSFLLLSLISFGYKEEWGQGKTAHNFSSSFIWVILFKYLDTPLHYVSNRERWWENYAEKKGNNGREWTQSI